MTCPCKYPIMVVHEGILFIGFSLEELETGTIEIPLIKKVKDDEGEWYVVTWNDDFHDGLETYDVNGHKVIAGCRESELSCDAKSIYQVKHPKDEWEKFHMIDTDKCE